MTETMFNLAGKLLLWFLSFSFICIIHTSTTLAQIDFIAYRCYNETLYTVNSRYQINLDTTLSALPTTNNGFGFFNHSTSQGNDAVNSIALCRGDMISSDECGRCLNDSIVKLRQLCPNQKKAVGYYDYCFLKYSDEQILGNIGETLYMGVSKNSHKATDSDQFNGDLGGLMKKLTGDAAAGGPLLKFSTGNSIGSNSSTIYGLVQCTPDLSEQQCSDCLDGTINHASQRFNGIVSVRVFGLMCYIRYETYRFTSDPVFPPRPSPPSHPPIPHPASSSPPLPLPILQPSPSGKKKNTTRSAIIITIIVIVTLFIIISSFYMIMRYRKKKNQKTPIATPQSKSTMDSGTLNSLKYDFRTVKAATNGFSEENKLGQGGFGTVYKGTLEEGHQIAVKRLERDSQQDKDFKDEVWLVTKLQHRNLVRLLGFSIEGRERLLIYEFMTNGSLDQHLFDLSKRKCLNWEKRYNIIKGIAKGLLYLHEDSHSRIIHRDMKASNVLLDAQMTPKIADFDTIRSFKTEEAQPYTRRVVGTNGYMAPEYVKHGQFSIKSDVFSYGVLVLEMVTGQCNQSFRNGESEEHLLSFAWNSWRNDKTSDIIDTTLDTGSGSLCIMIRSIHIGLLCVQENAIDRPTMASIVDMLNSSSMTPAPKKPAFFSGTTIDTV